MNRPAAHPVLTCEEAKAFEASLFAGDEDAEWAAMRRAGRAVADAILEDFGEIGEFPADARVLVLTGKGHNGGDALLAARRIIGRHPGARIEVVFVFGERALRPLARRAWLELAPFAAERDAAVSASYDVIIDGVFGFQFRPPLDAVAAATLRAANGKTARLRASVDLPSGLDESDAFRADFTYATGIVKTPLLSTSNAGRPRYLDLGFFDAAAPESLRITNEKQDRVLTREVLAPLRGLRPAKSDKRTFGHLFVAGGSRSYPGAVLMSVLAALRAGAGLVTAFVPESLAPAFAARVPEAMWVGWPETPEGGLALEGEYLLREKIDRADALLVGPGLGREAETLALVRGIVAQAEVPLVIDADALQADIVAAGAVPRVLTPHAGEWARVECAVTPAMTVIRKGPVTCVQTGGGRYHSFFGGPVLARGGSGDVLAGMTAGLLAQTPVDPVGAAVRATVWHGMAADALARAQGQVAATAAQLTDFMPAALRTRGAAGG